MVLLDDDSKIHFADADRSPLGTFLVDWLCIRDTVGMTFWFMPTAVAVVGICIALKVSSKSVECRQWSELGQGPLGLMAKVSILSNNIIVFSYFFHKTQGPRSSKNRRL